MKYIVNTHQAGLLYKNDSFIKELPSGTYHFLPLSKKSVQIVDKRERLESYGYDIALLSADKDLVEKLHILKVKDHELALHFVDNNFIEILEKGTHTYFKDIYNHSFIIVDTNNPIIENNIDSSIFANEYFRKQGAAYLNVFSIPSGKIGILTFNGSYVKQLDSGLHYFWKGSKAIDINAVDTRKKIVEINGQELLSEDKVTLRINFVVQYKIIDPVKITMEFENFQEQLYTTMQLALREYVATKKLDELLAERHEIGQIILSTIKNKEKDFASEFIEAGVKDIILPGEIREILNTVLIAEKKALANVITRREETASTRSLLNTAKLMDENKTLYKLKELEYLDHICDKVGSISLSSNAGILDQLGSLIKN